MQGNNSGKFTGVTTFIAKDGRVIYNKAFGRTGPALEQAMQANSIFRPLGMYDTWFYLPARLQSRLVPVYEGKVDGSLQEDIDF